MFNLRSEFGSRRRSAANCRPAGRAALRRLSVEAMEGRLMLSTNGPDFGSFDLLSTQFGLDAYQIKTAAIHSVQAGTPLEGGFVPSASSPLDGLFTSFDRTSVVGLRGSADHHVLLSPSTSETDFTSVTGNGMTDFDAVRFDTPGTPRLVIVRADSDGGLIQRLESTLAGNLRNGINENEGGAIPIQSILAVVGPGGTLESGERIVSKSGGEPAQITQTVTMSSEGGVISGEWARPTMLEMAGGEPVSIARPAPAPPDFTSTLDRDPRADQPLSSRGAPSALANAFAHRQGSAPSGGAAASTSIEETPTLTLRGSVGSVSQGTTSFADDWHPLQLQSRVSSNDAVSQELPQEPSLLPAIAGPEASAYAEAFAQFGTRDETVRQSLAGHNPWRESLKVTPLLMILALERIAASNSRRAKQESSASTSAWEVRSALAAAGRDRA